MANFAPQWPGDFESVARQYWSLWGDALRQAGGAPPTPTPGWQQAVDWWSQLIPGGTGQVHDVLGRFQRQAGDWFGQMQQVAARFAGRDQAPSDIASAWREALGMAGPQPVQNPFSDIFRAMQGSGAHGLDGWMEQARPYLDAMQREQARWMHLPTFGLSREQQERWQQLAQAQQDYQHQVGEYERLMLKVAQQAFELFEQKLSQRIAPGQQVESARALFDLWIDAAEQAYAEVALSAEFRTVYGALANAQMRLRLSVQREVEQVCAMFGMPTRTEVDSAHRKIVELERALRKVKQATPQRVPAVRPAPARREAAVPEATVVDVAPTQAAAAAEPVTIKTPRRTKRSKPVAARKATPRKTGNVKAKAPARAARAAAAKPVKRAATKPAAATRPVAKKSPASKAAAKKSVARKSVAKKSASKTSMVKKSASRQPVAKKAAKVKTGANVQAAGKASRPPPQKKNSNVRSATRATGKPAKKHAVPSAASTAPSRPSTSAVVSMKDWVARNAAMTGTQTPAAGKRDKKSKRGSRT